MRKRYLKLSPQEWAQKMALAASLAQPCHLCPRQCLVDRRQLCGICQQGPLALAHIQDHFGEEPFLVGAHGSAAFFFAGCNLRCVYCQNWEISRGRLAKAQVMTPAQLAGHFLAAQERAVSNINLVTPTIFLPDILQAIYLAAQQGLNLPIVYNTSSYESPAALALLADVVDIYLADFKYLTPALAQRYSAAVDYPAVALAALKIMQQQVGGLIWRGELLHRGLVIRHLVLPEQTKEAQAIAALVKKEFPTAYFSLLAQYDPPCADPSFSKQFPELNRRLTSAEYADAWQAVTSRYHIGQELAAANTWRPCFGQSGEDKFAHDD